MNGLDFLGIALLISTGFCWGFINGRRVGYRIGHANGRRYGFWDGHKLGKETAREALNKWDSI